MQMQFDADDIEAWAVLSGDRNPIHFDRDAARRMDAADVVVHGMLALLPIKQRLGRSASGEGWVQFKALLKAPVLRDAPVALSVSDRNGRVTFKLVPETGAADHVIGNVRRVDPPDWSSDAERHALPAEEVDAWLQGFRSGLGEGYDDWVALDAMVFGDFIRNRIGEVFDRLGPELRLEQRLERIESLTSHLLVQTSHQIAFCGSLHALGDLPPSIHYQVDNIDLIESPGEAVGTLDLGVHVQDRHVMTITLGLMVKKLQTIEDDKP
ncbi:MaoC/PaaZ C-terminal domain-containing protein [Lysobacter brunescens]|uniref:MaoC/PaaZ C-terminal domain-containing protein n=1 Tax=Lysobacter brunescens TaxID=262323 RepID=A0ABW2YGB6_9GAMM